MNAIAFFTSEKAKTQPNLVRFPVERTPEVGCEPAFVVLEYGRRTRLLRAFRDEAEAKRYLSQVKKDNACFAKPPITLIRRVDLY
jgi:hypothetical protein